MQKKCIFFVQIFGHMKKKQYFCNRFWETSVFRFSTGGPDIKIQIHLRGPNFFAPNWRIDEANWKIDTISVVQELIVKSMALRHETFTIEVPEKFYTW